MTDAFTSFAEQKLFADAFRAQADPDKGTLFTHVLNPNPRVVSDFNGISTQPEPVRHAVDGDSVKVKVTKIWVDEDGNTWAEGELDLPTPTHPFTEWSNEASNPLDDIRMAREAIEERWHVETETTSGRGFSKTQFAERLQREFIGSNLVVAKSGPNREERRHGEGGLPEKNWIEPRPRRKKKKGKRK